MRKLIAVGILALLILMAVLSYNARESAEPYPQGSWSDFANIPPDLTCVDAEAKYEWSVGRFAEDSRVIINYGRWIENNC